MHQRFDNVNLLRAFAALVVVTYHVIEHGHWTAFPASGPLTIFRMGWSGVDLFFVISGFVIAYSALSLYRRAPAGFGRRYWSHRIARIVPLYVVTIAAWIVLFWPTFFEQPAAQWGWQLLTHLIFIHNWWSDTHSAIDGVNWTLGVEMQFYLAVALLVPWIDRTPGWRIWLYGIAIAWAWRACMLVLYGHDDSWIQFVSSTQLPGALDEFGAGIFLAKWVSGHERRSALRGLAWLAAAAVAGWLVLELYWSRASFWGFPAMAVFWRTGFAVALLALVAAAVELPQVLATKWLLPVNGLGEVSYGIYLWHLFPLRWIVDDAGVSGSRGLLAVVAVTVLLATVSWWCLEKPIMRLARRADRTLQPGHLPAPAARTAA